MGYFDSVADKLKDISPPIQRRYLEPGTYVVGVKRTRMQKSSRLGKPDTFIADLVVLASSNPMIEVGAQVQWAPSMAWDGTMRDIMAFIAAVAKERFEKIGVPHLNALVEHEDAAFGKLVKVRAFQDAKKSEERKKEGKDPFTNHDWYPHADDPTLMELFKKFAS